MVNYNLPCHQGAYLHYWEELSPGAKGQLDPEEGFILPASQGKGLGCTKEPIEVQETT
jgi:hypothetical protein